jgi:hypothetical protein
MSYMDDRLKRKNGILPPLPTKKGKKALNKVSPKKKQEIAQLKNSGDDKLDDFFNEMKTWLRGRCAFCGNHTTWKNKDMWRIAIAHLLPKSKFKSVATNPNNWTELCWDCHTMFDSGKISWEMLYDSHEWLMLKAQLETILPMVAEEEKKNKLYSKLTELVYGKEKIE